MIHIFTDTYFFSLYTKVEVPHIVGVLITIFF